MSPASYQTAPPRDVSFKNPEPSADTPTDGGPSGPVLSPHGLSGPYDSESGASAPPRRAGNGTRTRDPNLGKVVLYQLSYSREADDFSVQPAPAQRPVCPGRTRPKMDHGGEGDRTPDLVNAIHALSQLSYAPAKLSRLRSAPRQHGNVARVAASVNEAYTVRTGPNAFVFTVIRRP